MKRRKPQSKPSQATLLQKVEVLNFHNYQRLVNSKHKQSDTIKYFQELGEFPISKSSFNRWIKDEDQLRHDSLRVTEKNKMKTKARRLNNPYDERVSDFLTTKHYVLKCVELSMIQDILLDRNKSFSEPEISAKFLEFSILYDGNFESESISGISWQRIFMKSLEYQLQSLKKDLDDQDMLQKRSHSLSAERLRISQSLKGFAMCDIYQFNELLFDVDYLYNLTKLSGDECLNSQSETYNITGGIRHHKTITLGLCCNMTGEDILSPLLVSNIANKQGLYNSSLNLQYYYFSPEGLNTREIFREFLTAWNTKLYVRKRQIALLLDTYWCHFGLINNYSNIKIIFISSKFDRTTSYYHKSQIKLPFSYGLERFFKYKLKIGLFKKILKNSRLIPLSDMDGLDIISHLKSTFNVMVDQFEHLCYKSFMELCFRASGISKNTNLHEANCDTGEKQIYVEVGRNDDSTSGLKFELLDNYTYLYSESRRIFIFTEEENDLLKFMKSLTNVILESHPVPGIEKTELLSALINEFTEGANERKFNQIYSIEGIVSFVKLLATNAKEVMLLQNHRLTESSKSQVLRIDKFLLTTLQPYLIAHSHDKNNQIKNEEAPNISPCTFQLFNQFYQSYIDDTSRLEMFKIRGNNTISSASKKKVKLDEKVNSEDDLSDEISESEGDILSSYNHTHLPFYKTINSASNQSSTYRGSFSDSE